MNSNTLRIRPLRAAGIALLAGTWIVLFAILGTPSGERRLANSETLTPARIAEKADPASSNTVGLHSFASIGSIAMTGLAVAALALPFGLSSLSLLRRTITLGSRVRRLALPKIQMNSDREAEPHDLLFQGTK